MPFNVYIDGLNLYKGFLSHRTFLKWLDLVELSKKLMNSDDVGTIYYFTSPMKRRFSGDQSPERQATYLRVLRNQDIQIISGNTVRYEKWLRHTSTSYRNFVEPQFPSVFGLSQILITNSWRKARPDSPKSKVRLFAEKASDVNLASYLMRDSLSKNLSTALVISGDTDLVTPIKFAKDAGTGVHVVIPNSAQQTSKLSRVASTVTPLELRMVEQSQLANPFVTKKGSRIFAPAIWR